MKYMLLFLFLGTTLFISGWEIDNQLGNERLRLGDLIVGSGEATTEEEADQIALQDLTSQIVVTVKSSFESRAKEDGITVSEYCERVVKTYSDVKLHNAMKLTEKQRNRVLVYRYITQESKERIFANRKNQIYSLISEGEKALEKDYVADGLRNFYWALMLLKSHPEATTMKYYFDNDKKERLLQVALPSEMERLLAMITIRLEDIDSKPDANCSELVFKAFYKNKPIDDLLVNHHDGYRWSQPTKWSNGLGYISVLKTTLQNQRRIRFKIDYTFANHSFTGDISSSVDSFALIELRNCEKEVVLTDQILKAYEQQDSKFTFDKSVSKPNSFAINEVLTAIEKKDLVSVRKNFTATGFQQFNALMGYGDAVVIPIKTTLKQVTNANNEIVRSVPMKFNFLTSEENFTEKVNFIFAENGKIDGISFALSEQACSDIIKKDFATDEEKMIIINFIEQYKTSYCLKDLEFIKNVFSNDALIIVGRVVHLEPDEDNDMLYNQLNKTTVEYVKLNKQQYIERLSNQFNNKDFINVRFFNNSVDRVMSDNSKLFGIQIAQYYYSSNYSDTGYLFLMFDLHDIKHPKIMVRSWQPEKNKDGTIVGLENFLWD